MPSAGFEPTITAIKVAAHVCLRQHSSRHRRRPILKQQLSLSKTHDNINFIIAGWFISWDTHINVTHVTNFFQESQVKEVTFYAQTHTEWENIERTRL
jgi:hypothetical protein